MASEKAVLATVQIMRGVAAILVVLGHSILETSRLNGVAAGALPLPNHGFGVDIFFVISGFIMMYTAGDGFGSPVRQKKFILARIARIVPIYWLLTTAMLATVLVMPSLFNSPHPSIGHVVGSYFFLPVPNAAGEVLPVLPLGWTLNYEMFFYVVFALAMALPRRAGVAAILLWFLGLAAFGAVAGSDNPMIRFWTDSIVIEFCYGILIGLFAARLGRIGRPAALASMAAGFLLFAAQHVVPAEAQPARFLFSGLPAMLIVAGAVALDVGGAPLRNRVGEMLGDASYSLYLSHMFVIRILRVLWNAAGVAVTPWLFVAAALVGACGAALILAQLLELPLHRYLKSRINGHFAPTPAPAVQGI